MKDGRVYGRGAVRRYALLKAPLLERPPLYYVRIMLMLVYLVRAITGM